MKHVYVLNMNPGFDKVMVVESEPQTPNVIRTDATHWFPSGKGLNVSRVFKTLGFDAYTVLQILGGQSGKNIARYCEIQGMHTDNIWIEKESRQNVTIIKTYNGENITYNEIGPVVSKEEISSYNQLVTKKLSADTEGILLVSGSGPNGYSEQDLLDIVSFAYDKGHPVYADIGGRWLKSIIEYPLVLLKVNRYEFFQSFNIDLLDRKAVEKFKYKHAIKYLVVTDGDQGFHAWDDEQQYIHRPSCKTGMPVRCTVGCGDSFLGGLVAALVVGNSFSLALDIANWCAAANTMNFVPSHFSKDDVEIVRKINGGGHERCRA